MSSEGIRHHERRRVALEQALVEKVAHVLRGGPDIAMLAEIHAREIVQALLALVRIELEVARGEPAHISVAAPPRAYGLTPENP